MYTETSTIKIKNKTGQSFGSHLNTYQGEPIRKSICQESKVATALFSTINIPTVLPPKQTKNARPAQTR